MRRRLRDVRSKPQDRSPQLSRHRNKIEVQPVKQTTGNHDIAEQDMAEQDMAEQDKADRYQDKGDQNKDPAPIVSSDQNEQNLKKRDLSEQNLNERDQKEQEVKERDLKNGADGIVAGCIVGRDNVGDPSHGQKGDGCLWKPQEGLATQNRTERGGPIGREYKAGGKRYSIRGGMAKRKEKEGQ
ncbi:hypothetical protein GNI_021980 [Gregarina niphandrodes]|uniref:Uncharacterized protein n=1 Tax=Gregarina niphandrodes TaxID=110365 RepID=A0A023BBQ1_GRENI|nr:hypothetical protein GNI_021980 [Gregarina niphandrodes]EZG80255.1 hypothetical protein GNI_021980 [Gregarina niphandrodes]|eukprot:XP_011134309.1 hypothetical protein GNI_021980 [Gregarina niphandrodes]